MVEYIGGLQMIISVFVRFIAFPWFLIPAKLVRHNPHQDKSYNSLEDNSIADNHLS